MRALTEPGGHVPRTCVWEITRACNLACQHCCCSAGCARPNELTTEECLRVVDELAALGTERLTLSGGEPTLRPDWPVIAARAAGAGIRVDLLTNGHGDARALAREARAAGLAGVGVSLDGLRETHDRLRAPGSFDRVCDTIRALAGEGVRVDVLFTANHWNVGEMADVHTLAGALGAEGFRVQIGKPVGRQAHREDLTLTRDAILTLLPALGRLAAEEGPVVTLGDAAGGREAIGIQSDGVAYALSGDGMQDPMCFMAASRGPRRSLVALASGRWRSRFSLSSG